MYCRTGTNSRMKTLHSYRPIIRYCHGTESKRSYITRGSMTRFCSRAVDAPSFMQITMRHLPLLHLDTIFRSFIIHPQFSSCYLLIGISCRISSHFTTKSRFPGILLQISLFYLLLFFPLNYILYLIF